jgi:uncharacterized protein (TIGR03083 family)
MITTPALRTAGPWLDALESTSTRLHGLVDGLTADQLGRPSFASGWTIAQVLSHLGSAAEICAALVSRGVAGGTAVLERSELLAIWARWDGLAPEAQRRAWGQSDRTHLALLRSITATDAETLTIPYFSGLLSLTEYAGFRLSEQTLHAWDVAVALDEDAVLPPAEGALLLSRINLIASRFNDAETRGWIGRQDLTVELSDTGRLFSLRLGDDCRLEPAQPAHRDGTITATTDALLRLVYGRNRPGDPIAVTGGVPLADLTRLFPGF